MKYAGIYQKWICLVLIITMSFTGMCLENMQAHSIFSYEKTAAEPHFYIVENVITNSDCCTVEQLGVEEIGAILAQMRQIPAKSCVRAVLLLLSLALLPGNSIYVANTSYDPPEVVVCTEHIIIGYIHQQDGEKG